MSNFINKLNKFLYMWTLLILTTFPDTISFLSCPSLETQTTHPPITLKFLHFYQCTMLLYFSAFARAVSSLSNILSSSVLPATMPSPPYCLLILLVPSSAFSFSGVFCALSVWVSSCCELLENLCFCYGNTPCTTFPFCVLL